MFNFFTDQAPTCGQYKITGGDYNHIKNVLRMKVGDQLLISANNKSNLCEIAFIAEDHVLLSVITEDYNDTNLPIDVHLFQGLPKADKMELIIQKCVELGVNAVTPVEMKRCVVKLEKNKKGAKTARWQAISESAAKQSKRTVIPTIFDAISYTELIDKIKDFDLFIIPYENKDGMLATKEVLNQIKAGMKVGVLVGPEGGFDQNEIDLALNKGGKTISLGKRILRTETASIVSLSMLMLHAEINL